MPYVCRDQVMEMLRIFVFFQMYSIKEDELTAAVVVAA